MCLALVLRLLVKLSVGVDTKTELLFKVDIYESDLADTI